MEEEFELEKVIGASWMPDLTYYLLKYNVQVSSLDKIYVLLEKIASAGDYDSFMNVLRMAMSNLSSPPYYLSPVPVDGRIVHVYVLRPDVVTSQLKDKVNIRADAETTIVLIYVADLSNKLNVYGWKLHWVPGLKKIFSEPMFSDELKVVADFVMEKEGRKEK